ncbi:fos-related antigen 1a isoform X1 [Nothobranchius furzeri]|uniref:FOS like antigen 1 n=1 Tax=Nothobranchius furzeri TaxID=105023 RepID=A0A9D3C1Z7_NOTFU|nr:fos-related antigen 1a isoform X1 [Nothobranchius furzeri]XP_054595171.1 fos-related antigen 1a isoform X1 [Nothobranchius furzeri]KAF7228460.1 FOS like antigen 1 [Nothobranchius furzeri]
MYRNFGSHGRGNPPYTGSLSGSDASSLGSNSTSTPQQKFTMTGSSPFVPSLNAITTNQDLQWLVQPTLMHPPGPSRSPAPPYPTHLGPRPLVSPPSQSHLLRPGVIRAPSHPTSSSRRSNDEQLSTEELERRRIRRERNKLAAAKCRNRRRELTDSLQCETEELEDEKSRLQKEIADLQKEKEKLELVLEAHRPICKIEESDSDSDPNPTISSLGAIKLEPEESSPPGPSIKPTVKMEKPKPKITIPARPAASATSVVASESESLHTPVLTSTPSLLSFVSSTVFTYPSSDIGSSVMTHGASHQQQSQASQSCGIAHRRSSSSGDQSDHSLHSPTILTL